MTARIPPAVPRFPDERPAAVVAVTTEAAAGTRRARILAQLARHPDLTAHELARLIGTASTVTDLLRDMQLKGQVIARTERRPQQGRPVHLWRLAPPGTVPPPRTSPAAEIVARRRERDRRATAARRARMRAPARQPTAIPLPGAACRAADPALFFPDPGDTRTQAQAVAICAGCPVRAKCYARAVQNGERWGIWGGVNFAMTAVNRGAGPGQEPEAG
jgi:DNA-binding transcriptional ArsR family regulator